MRDTETAKHLGLTLEQYRQAVAEGRISERKFFPERKEPMKRQKKSEKKLEAGPRWSFTLTLPVQIRSEANQRCHWAVRHRRFKEQEQAVSLAITDSPIVRVGLTCEPLVITLTHLGRKMDDDNCAGAFKGVRDFLANWLGVDDGSDFIEWRYAQRPGRGIEIKIEPKE